jgi:hypothetical protein
MFAAANSVRVCLLASVGLLCLVPGPCFANRRPHPSPRPSPLARRGEGVVPARPGAPVVRGAFGFVRTSSVPTLIRVPPATVAGTPFDNDRVDQALGHAIDFLMSKQRESGAIQESEENLTAMTALAIMAMTAVGHQPTDPTPEGESIRRGLAYVLRSNNLHKGNYFGGDGSRMYGHGITTLMLAEMLGMGVDDEQDQVIRERLDQAVKLILRSQAVPKNGNEQGGWRYTPDSHDADLSVTVWQVMALRSAKNAGLDVPDEVIAAAVAYLRRCSTSGSRDRRNRNGEPIATFAYQPGGHSTYAMAAAGLLAMQVCGEYDAKEVNDASDWLLHEELRYGDPWFFYGTYYYAQGMYQCGGQHWERARRRAEEILLQHQADDGSWAAADGQERNAGRIYATSMAVLSLSVKFHYLPIYQR